MRKVREKILGDKAKKVPSQNITEGALVPGPVLLSTKCRTPDLREEAGPLVFLTHGTCTVGWRTVEFRPH